MSASAYEVFKTLEAGGRAYKIGKRMFLVRTDGVMRVIQQSSIRSLLDNDIYPVRLPDRTEWVIRLSREIKITWRGAHMFDLPKL